MACRQTHRLTPVALSVEIEAPEPEYYHQFAACCRLAKAIKVVTITVRSAELGTPFNAEVERLRAMVALAAREGVRVGMTTEVGRMTENPDTAVVLCNNVKGLGITLDPSHYIYGPHGGGNYEQIMKYVYHVRLRDTSRDQLQVRVGQGEVEYGRLVNQLDQGALRSGAVRRHPAHAGDRPTHGNAEDPLAARKFAVARPSFAGGHSRSHAPRGNASPSASDA